MKKTMVMSKLNNGHWIPGYFVQGTVIPTQWGDKKVIGHKITLTIDGPPGT
jgi:hypothetical protein